MQVSVTQEHIETGICGSCYHCPVALAIREASHFPHVQVGRLTFSIQSAGREQYKNLPLPEAVCSWIWQFDEGLPVEPFTFELPLQ